METAVIAIDDYIALLRTHGWSSEEIDAEILAIVEESRIAAKVAAHDDDSQPIQQQLSAPTLESEYDPFELGTEAQPSTTTPVPLAQDLRWFTDPFVL